MAQTVLDTLAVHVDYDVDTSQLAGLRNRVQSLASGMQVIGGGIASVGLGLTGALAGVITRASMTQQSMTEVAAQTGKTLDEIESKYADHVRRISTSTGEAVGDVWNAFQKSISAGFEEQAGVELVESAARFQAAGMGDMSTAISSATTLATVFGVTATDALDSIARAAQKGEGDVADFAPTFKNLAGPAAAAGMSMEQLSGVLAAISTVAPSVSEGGTQFQAFLRGITGATERAREGLDALQRDSGIPVGVDAIVTRLKEQQDFVGVFRDLQRALGDDLTKISKVFRSAEAVKFYTTTDTELIERSMANTVDFLGTVTDAFDEGANTVSRRFRRLKQEIAAALEELGVPLLEMTVDVLGKLNGLVKWFRALPGETKAGFSKLLLLGPPLLLLGTLILGIAVAVKTVMAAVAAVGGAVLLKIIAVVAALVAVYGILIALFIKIYRESETFRRLVTDALEIVRTGWELFVAGLKFGAEVFRTVWVIARLWLGRLAGWLRDTPILGPLIEGIEWVLSKLPLIGSLIRNIADYFGRITETLRGFREEKERDIALEHAERAKDRLVRGEEETGALLPEHAERADSRTGISALWQGIQDMFSALSLGKPVDKLSADERLGFGYFLRGLSAPESDPRTSVEALTAPPSAAYTQLPGKTEHRNKTLNIETMNFTLPEGADTEALSEAVSDKLSQMFRDTAEDFDTTVER